MIAKALLPWMFVKRTDQWTPYVKIRAEAPLPASPAKNSRRPGKRPPRG